jgi:hypothetical protein
MEDGELYSQVFGHANVACRNDQAIDLDNTCMPLGINTIEESDIVFSYALEAQDGDFIINLAPSNRHARSFFLMSTSFLAGDLAFLAVFNGKENFSSSWCIRCKLTIVEWQNVCPVSNYMLCLSRPNISTGEINCFYRYIILHQINILLEQYGKCLCT